MIIAFLQLRDPPVLPALHQCPHLKLPPTDGHKSDFADDLDKLRGFGDKNESTLGELLFQFFRFYAHEFDYEKMALSVRLGKLIPKKDKNWHLANNNMLCVEEPFNRERNLGNTADEFSFRGLHLELRRAFDLIAEAKLEECCEQFVFPKEEPSEPKGYIKPAPRPAIIRSSSQQHSGRGGRSGGGRGNRNHFRNGNSSRRASSSNAYEQAQAATAANAGVAALPHPLMVSTGMPTSEMQWAQLAQHYPYHGDMAVLSNALFAQQDRWQWYAQQQAQMHQHAVAHAQRMQAGASQQTERSRTNSFDQPPLTAPPRPEYFVWPPHLQPAVYQHHAGFGTYPSSPSAATAVPEFRRSLHRSSAANESGSSSSNGTLRSQSQPASRTSAPGGPPGPGYAAATPAFNGATGYAARQANLSPFPAFISDDRTDSEVDDNSSRTVPDSPPEEDSAGYLGYFVADSSASPRKPPHVIPSFGDVHLSSAHRRKLSTEGPQAVLDKRLQRTSRSPSPLGHGRASSVGKNTAPIAAMPLPQTSARPAKEGSPLVVNGSTFLPASHLPSSWFPATTDETAYDNPLHISQGNAVNGSISHESPATRPQTSSEIRITPPPDRPLVVNGSTAQSPVLPASVTAPPSSAQRVPAAHGLVNGLYGGANFADASQNKASSWQRLSSRTQAGIAPLDLAINPMFPESQHLSPVYENRTPSPTAYRDRMSQAQVGSSSDLSRRDVDGRASQNLVTERNGAVKSGESASMQSPRLNGQAARETGATRGGKGEMDHGSAWQKPKSKKKADSRNSGKVAASNEQLPKSESERKGG